MGIARLTAGLSHANRRKVGAVAVHDPNDGPFYQRIISTGCNGTLPGYPNVCEDDEGQTLPGVVHAEENMIMKLREEAPLLTDLVTHVFVTKEPCKRCAELLVGAFSRLGWVIYEESSVSNPLACLAKFEEHDVKLVKLE